MTSTNVAIVDDIDELFDLGAPAAGIASAQKSPRVDAEGRKEPRVKVSWRARIQMPNGKVLELRVRDISDGGVGLLTECHIPASTVLNFVVAVPGLIDPRQITPVAGTIKTSYLVLQGSELICGGMWVTLPAEGRELLSKWIQRLRK